jgi:hypothetical protein
VAARPISTGIVLNPENLFKGKYPAQTTRARARSRWYKSTSDGISVDPSKAQEVLDWKPPTSVYQIRSFLGLAGYYQCFIPDFPE